MTAPTITREDAAKMLGISTREVRRKQEMGQLRVVKRGQRGLVLYDLAEIQELSLRKDLLESATNANVTGIMSFSAEEAKAVFAELRTGVSVLDCIEKLTIHPAKIRSILREYEALASIIILDAETMKAIHKLPLDGLFPITKASTILEILKGVVSQPCAVCTKNPRHLCKDCAIPYVKNQLLRQAKAEAAARREEAGLGDSDEVG